MTIVELDIIILVGLILFTVWLAIGEKEPRRRGVAVAVGFFIAAVGLAIAGARGILSPTMATASVHLPIAALCLLAVFGAMPNRDATSRVSSALIGLFMCHAMLSLWPRSSVATVAWVLAQGFTWFALPTGPARRGATPYLALAALAGAVGLTMGGPVGATLVLLAAAVRTGVFPFHTWVVLGFEEAPVSVAVALVAPMPAVALLITAPSSGLAWLGQDGPMQFAAVTAFSVAAFVPAALVVIQKRLDRALGLLTVSVGTVVILGSIDPDGVGHVGGLVLWSATGAALTGMGLVTSAIMARLGKVRVDRTQGLLAKVPAFAALFLVFALAAVGAPGTAGFASEDLLVHGELAQHWSTLMLFIAAMSLQGYGALHLFFRVFFGPSTKRWMPAPLKRERLALSVLAAVLVVVGLAPQLLIGPPQPTAVTAAAAHGGTRPAQPHEH